MTTELLSLLGGVVVAAIAAGGVALGHVFSRLSRVEDALRESKAYNRRLWAWARKHTDLYYRNRKDGSPDPEPIPEERE